VATDLRDDKEDAKELETEINDMKAQLNKKGGGAGAEESYAEYHHLDHGKVNRDSSDVKHLKKEIEKKSESLHALEQSIENQVKSLTDK
jgi:peptidoglycan hydrolase CwlO-like protein